jgi:hypothetical protein
MKQRLSALFDLLLLTLLFIGISYRLLWVDWNKGTSLHPDEYGLTNTLTHLSIPQNLGDYFNTRLSPISPYAKYHLSGEFERNGPDNRMRWGQWPIIFIRLAGELTGKTGYDEIRLLGRTLSALADIGSLLLIFLIGARLFNRRVGLLAAALSALAVMQIQQSHFMTVDNFGTLFVMLGMYAAVRVAQQPCAARPAPDAPYRFDRQCWAWCVLFGLALGMALACKVNLAPLAGMILLAVLLSIANLRIKPTRDLKTILTIAAIHLLLAGFTAALTFRLTQPMTFRASTGDTTFWTFALNPDWVESMKVAQSESSGEGGGPPAEQWVKRPAILFPLVNIVMWGMGLPLGLAAWGAFLWAAGRFVWPGLSEERRALLLPLVWTGGYFLFMGTRWVKSVRYFLPIYPFLCLFAAWGLLKIWEWSRTRRLRWQSVAAAAMAIVLGSALWWASAFTQAVYQDGHTRIRAALWMYDTIPAPFHLWLDTGGQPVGAPDGLLLGPGETFENSFTALRDGTLTGITLPHVSADTPVRLQVTLFDGETPLAETVVDIPAGVRATAANAFPEATLQRDQVYTLRATLLDNTPIAIYRTVLTNENWDEGLPMPFAGQDPFGQLYRGLDMEVRWYDDENKRAMFSDRLAQVDYLILPSQRGLWSSCRLPDMYPMTMAYYRALFDGSLGFEKVAEFQAPMRLGPLWVSDVGGSFSWNSNPRLPLFNNNPLAAEEAFSVYDHPPVWVFHKRADFNLEAAQAILAAIDLNQVVIQSPRHATGEPCRE